MSEAKHTRGPWSVTGNQLHWMITRRNGRGIIAILPVPINPTAECETLVGAYNNARLIAAAPELLAACETAIAENLEYSCPACEEGIIDQDWTQEKYELLFDLRQRCCTCWFGRIRRVVEIANGRDELWFRRELEEAKGKAEESAAKP